MAATVVLVFYALHKRGTWLMLTIVAVGVAGSIYGFAEGAWLIGVLEAVWAIMVAREWWAPSSLSAARWPSRHGYPHHPDYLRSTRARPLSTLDRFSIR